MPRSLLLAIIVLFSSMAFLAGNLWASSSNSKSAAKTKKQTELKPYSSLAKALKAAQKKSGKTAKISSKKRTVNIKSTQRTGTTKKMATVKSRSTKQSAHLAVKSQHKTPRIKKHSPSKTQSTSKSETAGRSVSR